MKPSPRALLSALVITPCAVAWAQNPQPAQSVIITGRSQPDAVRQQLAAEQAATPGGVTLVDGEGLRRRNVVGLGDLLRYVPGVWTANGSTNDSTFVSIRGSNLDATSYDGNGVKLMQDGLPVTAADGNNHNRDVDPLSARWAIVARGANALTYGASTLGGAIDFITPTARDGSANELLLNVGSFGQRQGRATLGAVSGAFDALATVEARRSDGWREHQQQRRIGLYANAGWSFDNVAQTRFYATAIDNDQQLPGALTREQWLADPSQAQAAALAGDYQYNVRTWRLANKTQWTIDPQTHLSAGIVYEEQRLDHPIVYAPPFFSLLIDTEQRNLGATLRWQRRAGAHDVLAGLNVGRTTVFGGNYRYQPGGAKTLATQVDNNANSVELFVVDRWQFAPDWTAVYGAQAVSARREVHNVTVAGGALRNPKADYDSINPRVGLIRQLTPSVQLFANLSRLYEAPTLYELEDDVRGGSATLEAMHGGVIEFGTRGSSAVGRSSWNWDVALYWAGLHDEMLSRDDPRAPGTSQSMNVDDTVHAGVEALLGASFVLDAAGRQRIEPLLNVTLNHFKFSNDPTWGNNRLPAAPRYAVKGEVLWRHAGGFFAGPTFDLAGSRYADFANTYTVDGYALWGLRAGYTAAGWEVFAEARNLSDKNHVSLFSVQDKAAADAAILYPGEPRSVYVGARLKF